MDAVYIYHVKLKDKKKLIFDPCSHPHVQSGPLPYCKLLKGHRAKRKQEGQGISSMEGRKSKRKGRKEMAGGYSTI